MADQTITLTGTASLPAESISIPAQTISLSGESVAVSVTLDLTTLAAQLKPLIVSPAASTMTAPGTGGITDAYGNTWVITANAQIAVNGIVDQTTANVKTLAWLAPKAGAALEIYQVNASGGVYSKVSVNAPWVATTWPNVTT